MKPIRLKGDLPCLFCEDRLFVLLEDKGFYEFVINCVPLSNDGDSFPLAHFAYCGEATRTNSWQRAEAEFDRLCAHVMAEHAEAPLPPDEGIAQIIEERNHLLREDVTNRECLRLLRAEVTRAANREADDKAEVARLTSERDEAVRLARRLYEFCDRRPINPLTDTTLEDAGAFLARIDAAKGTP